MRVVLAGVLALILAGCESGGTVAPTLGSSGTTSAAGRIPEVAYTEWPAFAHDYLRSGTQNAPTGISAATVKNLKLRWFYHPAGDSFVGQPIVAAGTLFVASRHGKVYALDPSTGALKWSRFFHNGRTPEVFYMTPLYQDGFLYVGSHNEKGLLVALDAANGNVVWQQYVPGSLRSAPVVVNGQLYVGVAHGDPPFCKPGGIYVFNAKTGEPGPDWITAVTTQADGGGVWGPLTFDGGNLLFGTGNTCTTNQQQANSIVALTLALSLVWSVQTAPSFDDRDVASGIVPNGNLVYAMGKSGSFYAVNRLTGRIVWSVLLNPLPRKGGFSSPTVVGNTILISNGFNPSLDPHKGLLMGLSMTGQIKWRIRTLHDIKGSESIAGGIAFVGLDNSIAAVDPQTGAILWRYVTQGFFYDASPAITPAGVFTADSAGYVYAFGPQSGSGQRAARALPHAWLGMPAPEIAPPKYCELPGK